MIASIIVAASANEVIGHRGSLPWHLPEDLRRFRDITTGHVVVMGRATHESILRRLGHPLANRTSIVISRTWGEGQGDGVLYAGSPESALAAARRLAEIAGDDEFFVIGGQSVYRQTLPFIDRIYLTRVHDVVDGDRAMAEDWLQDFRLIAREDKAAVDARLSYSFIDYERIG